MSIIETCKYLSSEFSVSMILTLISTLPFSVNLRALDCRQINFTINNASNLFEKMPIHDSGNSEVNLYPTDDIYFNYKIEPSKNNIIFMGDHFDISNAFQKIYTKDLIK